MPCQGEGFLWWMLRNWLWQINITMMHIAVYSFSKKFTCNNIDWTESHKDYRFWTLLLFRWKKYFFLVDRALEKIDFVLLNLTKGCLIPESFPIWLKSQKNVPNHYLLYYPLEEKVLRIVILSLFWDLSQSEECSDIKQLLKSTNFR